MSHAAAASPTGRAGLGLVVALLSAGTFGTSGAFAKSLLLQGWTPGAVVTARIGGAALLMLVPTVLALRGRWALLRRNTGIVTAYGLVAIAGCQLAYFNAVESLSVGVALLLEYLAPVLIVGYLWARHGRRPRPLTGAGVVLAVLGLLLVLDVLSGVRISGTGVLWGLAAACCLVVYFLLSGSGGDDALPPVALAGTGLLVGAVVLGAAGLLHLVPMHATTGDVTVGGHAVSWLLPVAELAVVAAGLAYATGIAAVRLLGTTVASFVALTEVLFAVLFAWLLLGELPRLVQLGGGVLIVAGVLAVRWDEVRGVRRAPDEAPEPSDFPVATPVA